jgi:NAD(P)-dependent dehydrogenase (short-subunit alcohol dehydrogenase family)
MELKGTVAIITGSTGRLGSAIANALALAGCKCICHYNRSRQRAKEVVERIQKIGGLVQAVEADFTRPGEIEKLFENSAGFGVPQILINSAAEFIRQPLAEVNFEKSQRIFNLNVIAPVLLSRIFAEKLRRKFADTNETVGKIVNIADVGGIRPWAEYVVYCSSKAGLIGATKALAKELAPAICVNAIAPGIVTWPGDFDELEKQRQLSFIPVRRIGEPQDVAEAVIFLLKNDYITGQVLNVDGGRCI